MHLHGHCERDDTMDEFPAMTDQEAIRTLLMLPWAIGDNTEDGQVSYSANEIKDVLRFVNSLCDRVEAAEAETEQLRFQRDGWMRVSDAARHEVLLQRRIVDSLQVDNETAEAEAERLRAEVTQAYALMANAVDADLNDDAHELEAAVAKMAMMLDKFITPINNAIQNTR